MMYSMPKLGPVKEILIFDLGLERDIEIVENIVASDLSVSVKK